MYYKTNNWIGLGWRVLGFPTLVLVDTLFGWPLFSLFAFSITTRNLSRKARIGWGVYISGWMAWFFPAPWWQTLSLVLLLSVLLQIARRRTHQLVWITSLVVGISLLGAWWLGEWFPYGWVSLFLLIIQVVIAVGLLVWIDMRHNLIAEEEVWYVQ